ncbi:MULTISPECIES: nucleoid-associated protein [unclassified Sedimentibacter]|uniref:nucleoid-associated protein n=1 Tax=unclassified Sedimentibacter TaxID=2649220 RepID=UPI0027E0C882|nr:nucleoid-associated protein [Sedimentibacter sp. MB35-C1]WMJ78905.1 nucleoid-associated protein [Sedimentibacter sp. MB35-C1]
MSVSITKAILHILDPSLGIPVLSENLMSFNDQMREYTEKHILKSYNDADLKKTKFVNQDGIFLKLVNQYLKNDDFIKFSREVSEFFFKIIAENPDIKPCDLMFVQANVFNKDYIVILKLNYKKGYIHFTKQDDTTKNIIIEQPCSLPATSQKIDEFIFVDLNSLDVFVKERKCQVYNEPSYYISKHILECKEEKPDKEKVKIITQATDKIIKEYYDDDMLMKSRVKNIIRENVEEKLNINIEEISEKAFKDEAARKVYNEEIQMKGIREPEIKVNFNYANKIKTKQKFITDEGIEINIPYEMLSDKEKVEFITNTNGTISIMLKNIDNIVDK